MKKVFYLLFIVTFFLAAQLSGQKYDRESLPTISYVQLPLTPLDTTIIKTYKVNVETPNNDLYLRDQVVATIKLTGFEKLTNPETDLTINVEVYPTKNSEPSLKSKNIKKEKDGVETIEKFYYYTGSFTQKIKLRLLNSAGEELFATEAGDTHQVSGDERKSSKEAHAKYMERLSHEEKEKQNGNLYTINNNINSQFGYPINSARITAFKIKPKKFEYNEFNTAFELVKNSIATYNEKDGLSDTEVAPLQKAIELFKIDIAELEAENKKARITKDVASAGYYNMSIAYFLMKKYDEAIESISQATELNKGIGQDTSLKSMYENMKKRTIANQKEVSSL